MPRIRVMPVVLVVLALAPANARADDTVLTVSAGATHTCALLSPSGRVQCWGEGAQGQLGDGTSTASPLPVTATGLAGATSVSAGTDHSCAVRADGGVDCWGFARDLFLTGGKLVPAHVPGVSGAIAVSAGANHDCAVLSSGGVQCWGAGTGGELGNGARANSATAVAVTGIGLARAVSAAAGHTCALDGALVKCWGRGLDGELGNGANADSATPVTASLPMAATAIGAGTNHACAVLSDRTVACWGSNAYGQLGVDSVARSSTPVIVNGVTDAIDVSAGGVHTCALLASRATVCWGHGGDGELGDGARRDSAAPVLARGVDGALAVSAGLGHTCAVIGGTSVRCWGAGDRGQLGDGRGASSAQPVTALLTLAGPEFGKSTTLQRVSGTVRVKPPGAAGFVALGAVSTLPVGTTIDTTRGKVRLTSAADAGGATQAGLFYDGEFTTGQQVVDGVGLTVLTLARVATSCAARAEAAQKKKKRKKTNALWGDAQGNFQSAGRHASATVRGTKWRVEDDCEGTTVSVETGSVRVENLVTHKITVLSAGRSLRVRASGRSGAGSNTSTTRSFVMDVEGLLKRLAGGRKTLAAALGGAMRCSITPDTAARRVSNVVENRASIRKAVTELNAPTARARTVRARLQAAVDHSLAADRHYRDWLSRLTTTSCPLPRTAPFKAAGREDVKATRAKQRFVAAFNPLASSEHRRTWRAAQF